MDDNNVNLLALRLLLKKEGEEQVDEAYNGEKALEKVLERMNRPHCRPYTLIFMDVNMPVMDGYEATERIREHVGRTTTTIIGASAYPKKEIEARGTEAGMDDFIGKPLDPADLVTILNRASNLI